MFTFYFSQLSQCSVRIYCLCVVERIVQFPGNVNAVHRLQKLYQLLLGVFPSHRLSIPTLSQIVKLLDFSYNLLSYVLFIFHLSSFISACGRHPFAHLPLPASGAGAHFYFVLRTVACAVAVFPEGTAGAAAFHLDAVLVHDEAQLHILFNFHFSSH